jgi:hypothetical protein
MTTTNDAKDAHLTGAHHVRLKASIVAIACVGILLFASYLTPDPRGFGTHEQLGLPPCISTNFLGVPCPLCGMTTSFSLMAHARPVEAFLAQPAGAVLFALCVLTLAGALTAAVFGYVPRRFATVFRGRLGSGLFIALLTGAWLYKVVVFFR